MNQIEILKYIGNLAQIGGCRHYTLSEGLGRGMRATDINTGSGLQYTVLPDRGLDISLTSFRGMNLVYLTCNGETHPSFYEPEGIGWLRTFTGGLLTTCGLTHFGGPASDNGEEFGLHGRYSTLPARQYADLSGWMDGEYHLKVKGLVEEGFLFGKKLRMEREISSIQGKNVIRITDTITNFGPVDSPYMILYHMNFGYPLLSEDAEFVIHPASTEPRDENAIPGLYDFRSFIKPEIGYKEQVFFHTMEGDKNNETSVSLKNKKLGIAVDIKFNISQLPFLTEWKMMGEGEYVLGIEPCNVFGKPRKLLREENTLPMLQPGESAINSIEISLQEI